MRLTDFGLAVIAAAGHSLTTTTRGGAFGWLAPELIDPDMFGETSSRPTFASDIYSFACVCIEVSDCVCGLCDSCGLTGFSVVYLQVTLCRVW